MLQQEEEKHVCDILLPTGPHRLGLLSLSLSLSPFFQRMTKLKRNRDSHLNGTTSYSLSLSPSLLILSSRHQSPNEHFPVKCSFLFFDLRESGTPMNCCCGVDRISLCVFSFTLRTNTKKEYHHERRRWQQQQLEQQQQRWPVTQQPSLVF